ncbi:MAG: M28 family peptidase [Sphingomonadales bacterium]|nr:M28 family peptidase [Sphingomonadales bacterium]
MKRGRGAMKRSWALPLAVALFAVPVSAAPKRDRALEAELMAHITTLASDDFQGREPGTDGEAKTLRYLGREWFDIGMVSGTNDPGHEWFAPVELVAREPAVSVAQFFRHGHPMAVPRDAVLMLTSGKRSLLRGAPLLFVGTGQGTAPARNELAGRVALLLDGGKEGSERQNALLAGGASAVITVLDGDRSLENVTARRQRSGYALASDALGGDLEGFITKAGMERLLSGSDATVAKLEAESAKPDFAPRLLDLSANLEATTRETTIRTHNIIGKLPGKRRDAGAVLFMAHWDHFGICATPPAEHLICNGAIDNASGVGALTEIARRLSRGPQLDRDVYFLATTSEELGLLGAEAFAENPPLPLGQIVAAFNLDTVALAPAGSPLAIVGKGMTPLDARIAEVARQQKRKLVDGAAANAYVRRQDGWALLQHDVPAVLVSSAYGDIDRIEHFFDTDYHRPGDRVKPGIELGGAAEDVAFHVALARYFGDVRKVPVVAK